MQPTSLLANQVSNLLATDTTQLAAAAALKLHLSQTAFTPSLSLTLGGLTEASFTGYAALAAGAAGAQTRFFDPATGNGIVEIKSPVGGWLYSCSGVTGLPQTIYGGYVTDNGSAALYGAFLLGGPVTITASGQAVDIPTNLVRFTVPASPVS